jgi:anti-sigma-K factor RskA
MICLSRNEQGAELLASYLAKTLDAARTAELDRHIQECADCRGLVTVWERLDEFTVPEVTPGFDARLHARIAAEETRRVWWRRLLWRPVAPLAAAGAALVALALYVHPLGNPAAPKQESLKQVNNAEIEQVAQALDDLDLLSFR